MVDAVIELFWNLLEAEHPKAEAFARKLAGNRADGDDLYQDALLAAMRKFAGLRDKEAFKPWLYRIIINTYVSECRRNWRKKQVTLTTEIVESLYGDDPSRGYDARRWIEIALNALQPDERALVTLFEIEGWTITELSGMLGKPEGTIKSRLARSRAKMRQAISGYLQTGEKKVNFKEETGYALPQSET
jgi:RNA polymerase sigma-70 factor (ECF subfamily)